MKHNKQIQQTTAKKKIQGYAWLCGKGDLFGIEQEIKMWPRWKMVYA